MTTPAPLGSLLVFNLATDVDHPLLGFTADWVAALATVADHVDVLTMTAGRHALPANVRVYSVGKEHGHGNLRRASTFYRLLRRLTAERPYDACFSHMMPLFAVMGAPVLRRHGIPVTLWYCHSATSTMLRMAERMVDRVVTAHPDTFRLPSGKVEAIGHAIDVDLFAPVPVSRQPDRPFTIVAVGRVAPIKRVEVMVEALGRLAHARPGKPVHLRLVGPTDGGSAAYVASLRDRARALGVADSVEFAGPVGRRALPAEYSAADVAVNLSPAGLFDKAALEAMACGLPLVTSNRALAAEVTATDPRLAIAEPDPVLLADALGYLQDMGAARRVAVGEALRRKTHDHATSTLPARLLAAMPRRAATRAAVSTGRP